MNVLKETRLAQWACDVQEWKDSGLTQAAWCDANGVNINTFRYRLRALNESVNEKMILESKTTFAQIQTPFAEQYEERLLSNLNTEEIIIDVKGVKISINESTNMLFLKDVIEVLKSC